MAVTGLDGVPKSADRQGRYWAAEAVLDNGSGPRAGTVTALAAKVGGGGGGTDLVHTVNSAALIGQAVQSFTYDDDGNLTGDGTWNYTYDAENRLTVVETPSTSRGTSLIPNASARRLEFQYDAAGRRVSKVSYKNWNGSTYTETVTSARYLYDGWNLVAEFLYNSSTSTYNLNSSYTWGLDLAGSLSASGGIGALLQIHDHAGSGKTLLATYDGNGNLAALLNASTGDVEAAYEYDPFGNLLRTEGAYAKTNPFRFSSKFTDDETGLVYYGHRYYSPNLGRFINRDPIGESGGLNLYGFCGNDGMNGTDYLGMVVSGDHPSFYTFFFPFDFDDGPIGGGSFGPRTRTPGTMSPMGPPGRSLYGQIALGRGRAPTDARRFYANDETFSGEFLNRSGDFGIRIAESAQSFDEAVWTIFLDPETAYDNAKEGIQDFSDLQRSVIDRITEKIWGGAYQAPVESYVTYEALAAAISDIGWDNAPDAAFELGLTVVGGRLVRVSGGRGMLKLTAKQLRALGFQDHHIIHQALKKHRLLKLADFDIESRANKIWLPDDPEVHPTRSIHNGSHRHSVRDNLADQMDAAVKRGRTENWTTEQYRQALLDIIRDERTLLRSGERALNKHHRPGAK